MRLKNSLFFLSCLIVLGCTTQVSPQEVGQAKLDSLQAAHQGTLDSIENVIASQFQLIEQLELELQSLKDSIADNNSAAKANSNNGPKPTGPEGIPTVVPIKRK